MELWIRSQDKKVLVKINNIYVNENGVIFTDSYPNMWLGAYKSEKRALEVLDKIQEHMELFEKTIIEDTGFKYYGNVYEMPEK